MTKEAFLSEDVLKGQWKQLQSKARHQWGKITDVDLSRVQGNRDVLVGTIQSRYGRTRDEASRDVEGWLQGTGIRRQG